MPRGEAKLGESRARHLQMDACWPPECPDAPKVYGAFRSGMRYFFLHKRPGTKQSHV